MDSARQRSDAQAALAQIALPDGLYLVPALPADQGQPEAARIAEEQAAALVLLVALLILLAVLSLSSFAP
jgi:hypothetical protein